MNKTGLAVLRSVIPTSPVFTTRAAAAAAHVSPDVASRDLARVAAQGIVTRIVPGIWADVRHPDFSPYAVVPHLVRLRQGGAQGYVSLLSALNLHGMIQQIPRVVHVVVHEQRRALRTPVGTYEFHQIGLSLFGGFAPFGPLAAFDMATPAKALFDALYLSARRARRFGHLPELTLPTRFRHAEMERWIRTIAYPSLRSAVAARWLTVQRDHGLTA